LLISKPLTTLREIIRSFQAAWKDFSEGFAAICSRSQHPVQLAQGGFMAKQTKITIETDSLLILRGRSSVRAWCPGCAAQVEMIALEDMGVISNLERPELEEWLNSGELHRLQATDGSALTCLNSLLARVQRTTMQPGDPAATKQTKESI
jgi:hypothetical protein